MNKIAHRGNIAGIYSEYENRIDYLWSAISIGYWIECDVRMYNNQLYFGHDEPQQLVDFRLLEHPRTICHAKDLDALQVLHNFGAHYFWHENDRVTLTSERLIWCFPGEFPINSSAIWLDVRDDIMLPRDTSGIWGICSDDFTK